MQSKISYFKKTGNQIWNKEIWWKDIISFWPLWTLELLFLQVITTLPLINQMNIVFRNDKGNKTELRTLFYVAVNSGSYIVFIAVLSILAAVLVFGYLNSSRSTYMLHSLPISRRTYFTTHFLSGLFMIFAPFAVTYGVLWGIGIKYHLGMGAVVFSYLLATLLVIIFFYSLACVVVMLSGNSIMSLVIYGVSNVLEVGFRLLLAWASQEFIYANIMLNFKFGTGTLDRVCTPILGFVMLFQNRVLYRTGVSSKMLPGMLGNYASSVYFTESQWQQMLSVDWKSLGFSVLSLIVSAIFLLLAFKLYQKRPLERVGDLVAFNWCKPIFRAVFCACGSLLCVSLFSALFSGWMANITYENLLFVCMVFLVFGCIISYLAGDMILAKSFFIWKKLSWVQMGIFCGVMLMVLGANYFISINHHISAMPQEKVKYVSFRIDGVSFLYSSEEYERLGLEKIRQEIVREGQKLTPAETGRIYNDMDMIEESSEQQEVVVSYEYILDAEGSNREYYYYCMYKNKQEELFKSLEDAVNSTDNMAEAVFTAAYESAECTGIEIRKRPDADVDGYVENQAARERVFKAFLKDLQEGKVRLDNWNAYSDSVENRITLLFDTSISDRKLREKNVPRESWWEYLTNNSMVVFVTEEMANTWAELQKLDDKDLSESWKEYGNSVDTVEGEAAEYTPQ